MKPVGILLVVVGLVILCYGWFGAMVFKTKENVAKLGPLEINKEKEHAVPIGPIAGGLCMVGGILVLVTGGRKT